MDTLSFTIEKVIKAPITQVYHAFTNATVLREWLCDIATVAPQPGGRIYMVWNSGYYTCGEYISLTPESAIVFTWQGRGDPGQTQVRVDLTEKTDGIELRLTHSGLSADPSWARTVTEIQEGWKSGLDNLVSTLETGEDLRIVRRPMLGITISDFNEEIARNTGVPVSQGIRLDSVLGGMGAQAAGLQAGDVLVSIGGLATPDFACLSKAVQGRHAGEQIEVVFYRGPEKKQVIMQLSHRPIPEIPWSIQALAKTVRQQTDEALGTLDKFCAGVSESEAEFRPKSNEWSSKEVLAHLIQGERDQQAYIVGCVGSQEQWSDDYAGNLQFRLNATLVVYPSLPMLLSELRLLMLETAALYDNLPVDFIQRKSSYWRLAYQALQGPYHLNTHLEQMRASIEAKRRSS